MIKTAPQLLAERMPLVRHIENELTSQGYKKGTVEFLKVFNSSLKFYEMFAPPIEYKKDSSWK